MKVHLFGPLIGFSLIASMRWINLKGSKRRANYTFWLSFDTFYLFQRSVEQDTVDLKGGHMRSSDPREKGQGLAEYGMIIILVAIVVMLLLLILGPGMGNLYSNIVVNF